MTAELSAELQSIAQRVREIVSDPALQPRIAPPQLVEAVTAYPRAGGKAVRPALLTWACRLLGGEEAPALRAGAAAELYHTYTLVHDDVIDRDPLRRGQPSVHALLEKIGRRQFHLGEEAAHYGVSMAILAGDCLHSWAVALLASLPELGVSPTVMLRLVHRLQQTVGPAIVEGEARDIQLPFLPVEQVSQEDILEVIRTKTAALFAYCGWAGGLLARGEEDEDVAGLTAFAEGAGIAFQLQDDVLGLVGEEATLGKPVGNDLREGKRTMIIALAWQRANEEERAQLGGVLGDLHASPQAAAAATALLRRVEAIDDVRAMAGDYLRRALEHLDPLPESRWKGLLRGLAASMVGRER